MCSWRPVWLAHRLRTAEAAPALFCMGLTLRLHGGVLHCCSTFLAHRMAEAWQEQQRRRQQQKEAQRQRKKQAQEQQGQAQAQKGGLLRLAQGMEQ